MQRRILLAACGLLIMLAPANAVKADTRPPQPSPEVIKCDREYRACLQQCTVAYNVLDKLKKCVDDCYGDRMLCQQHRKKPKDRGPNVTTRAPS